MIVAAAKQNSVYDIRSEFREDAASRLSEMTARENRRGTAATGKSLAETIRDSMVPRETAAVVPTGDSVTISEEGRSKQRSMAAGTDGEGAEETTASAGFQRVSLGGVESAGTAADAKEELLEQIKEVKEELADAQQRLSQAMSETQSQSPTALPPEQSPEDPDGAGTAPDAGQARAAAAPGGDMNTDAESIEAEVTQLQARLQILYQQLQESSQSGATAMGSAGLGGSGDSGGLGERISVSA